jgi:hypothetical protein
MDGLRRWTVGVLAGPELLAFKMIMLLPGRRSYGWLFGEVEAPMVRAKARSGVESQ